MCVFFSRDAFSDIFEQNFVKGCQHMNKDGHRILFGEYITQKLFANVVSNLRSFYSQYTLFEVIFTDFVRLIREQNGNIGF